MTGILEGTQHLSLTGEIRRLLAGVAMRVCYGGQFVLLIPSLLHDFLQTSFVVVKRCRLGVSRREVWDAQCRFQGPLLRLEGETHVHDANLTGCV